MIYSSNSYKIPKHWLTIQTIEMHTGGEPLRVILDGFPEIHGASVLGFRDFIKSNYDHLRTALMFEPRGHADMYGAIVTPSKIADFGVVFMHNQGYSTMCGHATIAIAKLAVEAGWVTMAEPETKLTIEAPCGVVTAFVTINHGKVGSIRFLNVPSFVAALDETIKVPGLGLVRYDLAYGGAYYALVDADRLNIPCTPKYFNQLIQTGMDIKKAVIANKEKLVHPEVQDLSFLYGTIFIGSPVSDGVDSRNVCIFADGELDRSPTGSGVSARMAVHYHRGELKVGQSIECRISETVNYHGIPAIIPEVSGRAYVTGKNVFTIDPDDPLQEGFMLR
jgi:trans-L-3-hydroxyproline dehydratase